MKMSRAVLLAFLVLGVLPTLLASPAHAGLIGSDICISGSASRWTDAAHGNANGNYLIIWPNYSDPNMNVWNIFVSNNPNYSGNLSTDYTSFYDYNPNGSHHGWPIFTANRCLNMTGWYYSLPPQSDGKE